MRKWNSFNALGRPLPPLLMSAAQMLCLTIPLAILGNNFWFRRDFYRRFSIAIGHRADRVCLAAEKYSG